MFECLDGERHIFRNDGLGRIVTDSPFSPNKQHPNLGQFCQRNRVMPGAARQVECPVAKGLDCLRQLPGQ